METFKRCLGSITAGLGNELKSGNQGEPDIKEESQFVICIPGPTVVSFKDKRIRGRPGLGRKAIN